MEIVDWFGDGSVAVTELALACCAVEFEAAAAGRPRLAPEAVPGDATRVLVVSGTVSRPLASRVTDLAAEFAADHVVAFGACASAGGPYWDSPVVTTVPALLPVAACVPGCAPTPAALHRALEALR